MSARRPPRGHYPAPSAPRQAPATERVRADQLAPGDIILHAGLALPIDRIEVSNRVELLVGDNRGSRLRFRDDTLVARVSA